MSVTAANDRNGVCLCVIFNHPFPANLPLLRKIYQGRFKHVRFLMPLMRSDDPDVLTVYRGSFSHHAYLGDHRKELLELSCAYYVMVQDDVLLAPWLDESNIVEALGIKSAAEGFISNLDPAPRDVGVWGFQAGSLWRMILPRNIISGTGTDTLPSVLNQLPPAADAAKRAETYGIPATTTFSFTDRTMSADLALAKSRSFGRDPADEREFVRHMLDMLFGSGPPSDIVVPYPIATGGPNTDFYVVPAACLDDYVHIAGVLAAAGLFVEMAGPTALMLSCERVRTLRDTGREVEWAETRGTPSSAIERLIENDRLLLVHPVKLSAVEDPEAYIAQLATMRATGAKFVTTSAEAAVLAKWPDFDAEGYLRLNPDVRAGGTSAFVHFLDHGIDEGRRWRD